jgi:hypothetical protein
MSKLIAILIVTSCMLAGPVRTFAQAAPPAADQSGTYELVLRDGSRVFGTIVSEDEDQVVLRTQAGATVTAARSDVESLKAVGGEIVDGRFFPPDPNATRLFFGPTGRSLKRGQTYLGVYEFVMPFVQIGITDRLSVGGGTPLVFGFEEGSRFFWITPKLQILNRARTQVAVGAFQLFNPHGDGGGFGYVVGTHGSSTASFTAGGGLAYGNQGGRSGVAMLGGERQVRRNLKLMTENYLWKDGHGIASGGVRFFGDRLSADLAIAVPIGTSDLVGFPVLNFVYVF